MQKNELDKLLNMLHQIVKINNNRLKLIQQFQNHIWNMNDKSPEYEILNELAMDLDYYESDTKLRKEASSYYGEDKLIKEIQTAISRINSISR